MPSVCRYTARFQVLSLNPYGTKKQAFVGLYFYTSSQISRFCRPKFVAKSFWIGIKCEYAANDCLGVRVGKFKKFGKSSKNNVECR